MKLLVAVGSYERILYGIDVEFTFEQEEIKIGKIMESFAIPAHTGCLKSLASCKRFLVSGATDESIRIFDLKRRKDIGTLSQHQGTVTSLAFTGDSHLLSGGEDGRIGLFRTKDWECLHILRHKKPVTSITIHPSGKLALSVGRERSVKLWNLMTGKQAHSSSFLPYEPVKVLFSETGKYYAILSDYNLVVYETDSTRKVFDFKSKTRLMTFTFFKDEIVYVAGEGTLIQQISFDKQSSSGEEEDSSENFKVESFETEQGPRIKGLAISTFSKGSILLTASSSGSIKGWTILPNTNTVMKEAFSHDSKIRITCLTATL